MLAPDRVLEAVKGQMTAAQIAAKLGEPPCRVAANSSPSPRRVVPVLNRAAAEDRVVRIVTGTDPTVARWSRAA